MKFSCYALLTVTAVCVQRCHAFTSTVHKTTRETRVGNLHMFFADDATPASKEKKSSSSPAPTQQQQTQVSAVTEPPPPLELIKSDSEKFLNAAGAFLVDAFWLNSKHHQIDDAHSISDDARLGLIVDQSADLQEKYGERMGLRLTNGAVIGALDPETRAFLGLVTLKETLMKNDFILEAEKAETIAKNAVASLGPKQRREYKNAPLSKIAEECLPGDTKSVCVLANLAVSPEARRRGVAKSLCNEVEALAEEWGYNELHLLVEEANTAGRGLYEDKLGYEVVATKEGEIALRADINSGEFKEIQADTLVMMKNLN